MINNMSVVCFHAGRIYLLIEEGSVGHLYVSMFDLNEQQEKAYDSFL